MMEREQRLLIGLAVVTGFWLVGVELAGSDAVLLHLAPLVLLSVLLASGRFPGESFIAAVLCARPRRFGTVRLSVRSRRAAVPPRGGRLLAFALAGRAPPRRPRGRSGNET